MSDRPEPSGREAKENAARTARDRGTWIELAAFGIMIPACVWVGWKAGAFVDARLGWRPWGSLAGVLLGFGAALLPLVRLSARAGGGGGDQPGGPPPGSGAPPA